MRSVLLLPFLLSLLAAADASAQECADHRVKAELTRLRRELDTQAVSCAKAARGDLDGDGAADAVLLVSYEGSGGGNSWGNTIYVLPAAASAPLLSEPDDTWGRVDSITVSGRSIRVKTLEMREGDNLCCPSGRGEFVLRVENRRLVLVPDKD